MTKPLIELQEHCILNLAPGEGKEKKKNAAIKLECQVQG